MTIAAKNVEQSDALSFLLNEFERLSDALSENEAVGERRVNFFITFVTAVLAGLIALATKPGNDPMAPELVKVAPELVKAAAVSLLLIGLFTLLRIIHRNETTDDIFRRLDEIRRVFLSPELAAKLTKRKRPSMMSRFPFPKLAAKLTKWKLPSMMSWFLPDSPGALRSPFRGGLAQLVAVVNSILVGVYAAENEPTWQSRRVAFWFVASFVAQLAYVGYREWKPKQQNDSRQATAHEPPA